MILPSLVKAKFPRLHASGDYEQRSPPDDRYNCIAFAAGETDRWWWPGRRSGVYWPPSAPFQKTVLAFVDAYASIGFEECDDGEFEEEYDKVVLYAKNGLPTHAARQEHSSRMWLSKLGSSFDIAHTSVDEIGGDEYGEPVQYLRRRRPQDEH